MRPSRSELSSAPLGYDGTGRSPPPLAVESGRGTPEGALPPHQSAAPGWSMHRELALLEASYPTRCGNAQGIRLSGP